MFLAVVYGKALQGLMVNSRQDWNLEYLVDLREKFLQQEYPLAVINSQFKRALEVDRLDLIFGNPALRKNKKKKVVAPLILTYNPSNPPVKTWIKEGMEILHKPFFNFGSLGSKVEESFSESRCSFHAAHLGISA